MRSHGCATATTSPRLGWRPVGSCGSSTTLRPAPDRCRRASFRLRPMASGVPSDQLLHAPLAELMAEAARLRDRSHGARVTFSPKVFIPLTMLCRDRCGYCTFAKPPARLEAPFLELDDVLDVARRGA